MSGDLLLGAAALLASFALLYFVVAWSRIQLSMQRIDEEKAARWRQRLEKQETKLRTQQLFDIVRALIPLAPLLFAALSRQQGSPRVQ